MNSLDLVAPVPLGAPDDGKAPSFMVIGDPAGSMPANTHLFQCQDYKNLEHGLVHNSQSVLRNDVTLSSYALA